MPIDLEHVMTASSIAPWADQYMLAWASHDVDAILAFHTEDTEFTSAAFGRHAVGKVDVRLAFLGMFALWPDLTFQTRRLYLTPDIIVYESTATGTQSVALTVGETTIEATGQQIAFDVVDIFPLRDGLIARKDTYFDAHAYILAMKRSAVAAGCARP